MTTQIAARNVPDVFWVPSAQVMTYAASGLFHELDGISTLDLSDYSAADIDMLRLDGKHNTMALGIFVPVLRYNATIAEADGIELPADGVGWTWDALSKLAIDYAANHAAGHWALSYGPDHDLSFESWLRQRGEQLWTEDGQMGFTVDGLASWFDWWETLRKAGATPSLSEQDGVAADWSLVGNKVLAMIGNSNHIIDDAPMFPDQKFKLRHVPALADAAAGYQYLYIARLAIYGGIDKANLKAAGAVLNFNTNSTEMLRTVHLTMGAPVNPRVAKEVQAFASADELEMLAVVAADRAADRKPRFEAPAGSSTWRSIMTRVAEEVALDKSTTTDAASKMIDEIKTALARAS